MARYIDADAEIAKIQKEIERLKHRIESHMPDREDGWIDHDSHIKRYEAEIKDAEREIRMLKSYTTVDVVEVVRCENCKWYSRLGCNNPSALVVANDENYCSYGKRRTDGEIH